MLSHARSGRSCCLSRAYLSSQLLVLAAILLLGSSAHAHLIRTDAGEGDPSQSAQTIIDRFTKINSNPAQNYTRSRSRKLGQKQNSAGTSTDRLAGFTPPSEGVLAAYPMLDRSTAQLVEQVPWAKQLLADAFPAAVQQAQPFHTAAQTTTDPPIAQIAQTSQGFPTTVSPESLIAALNTAAAGTPTTALTDAQVEALKAAFAAARPQTQTAAPTTSPTAAPTETQTTVLTEAQVAALKAIFALAPTETQTAAPTTSITVASITAASPEALNAALTAAFTASLTAAPTAPPKAAPTDGPTQANAQSLLQSSSGTTDDDCAGPWTSDETAREDEMLRLVNVARSAPRSCGVNGYFPAVQQLAFDAKLRCAAKQHSKDMATRRYFSHDTLGSGQSAFSRMEATGFAGIAGGENIAAGQETAADATDGLLKSDGHCANIMGKDHNLAGIGCYHDVTSDRQYEYYWTQDFGSVRG